MELNAIEKYFIEKFESLEKENIELKKQLEQKQNSNNLVVNQVFKSYYQVSRYHWAIKEDNYHSFEKALKEKDFKWLGSHEYDINLYTWNYEITIANKTFYFHLYSNGGELMLNNVEPKSRDCFETLEEAQNQLLIYLEKDIEEIKAKLTIKGE